MFCVACQKSAFFPIPLESLERLGFRAILPPYKNWRSYAVMEMIPSPGFLTSLKSKAKGHSQFDTAMLLSGPPCFLFFDGLSLQPNENDEGIPLISRGKLGETRTLKTCEGQQKHFHLG